MKETLVQVVSYCALACAALIVSFHCPFFFYQEKEPEEVRKLRKF